MNNEGLRPHEVASEIMQADYRTANGRVESLRLNSLIDRSETVWRELAAGSFERNEYGHTTVGIEDWTGDYQTPSGDHVDGLKVYFHDPYGTITELGGIRRIEGASNVATARVFKGEGQFEPLLPDDRRWDAIVGTIERAIVACRTEKQAGREEQK
jgi:hypothetical protein